MEKGDKLEIARDIHHWAYFKNQTDRKSFRGAIQVLGYRIESEKENTNSELCYGICIVKRQEMTPKAVDDAVLQLFRASRCAHGEYDGWECQLIVDAKPSRRDLLILPLQRLSTPFFSYPANRKLISLGVNSCEVRSKFATLKPFRAADKAMLG